MCLSFSWLVFLVGQWCRKAGSGEVSVWDGVTIWEDLQSGEALVGFCTEWLEKPIKRQSRVRYGFNIRVFHPLIEIIIKINNYRASVDH